MCENSVNPKTTRLTEMRDLMRRMYTQRNRFRGMFPENLSALLEEARQEGKKEGVGFNQYYAYYSLGNTLYRRSEPMAMGELSRVMDIPFSTATHLVDAFVKNGYAQRSNDPDDRRVVLVELTEPGRQILETANNFVSRRIVRIMDAFTDEEQDQIITLMRKFVTILETEV